MLDAMAAEQDRAARARARQAADTAEMNALAARRKLNDERSGKTATAPAPAAVASQPTPAQAQAVLPAMIPIVTEVSGDHGRYDAVVRYQDGRRVRIRAGAILADGSKVVRITADDVTVKDASGDEHQLPQAGAVAASPVGGR